MEETGQQMYDEGGKYHGFQIWLNMPAQYKYIDPTTHVYQEDKMDVIENDNYYAKVVLGELFDAKSKIELLSPAFYYHVKMKANGRIDIPTDPLHNAFVYVIDGNVEIEEKRKLKTNQIALYQRGESIINMYAKEPAELLVLGGQPLNEPVFSYGPFVMNNEEQIRQCVHDYNSGKMGNPDIVNR